MVTSPIGAAGEGGRVFRVGGRADEVELGRAGGVGYGGFEADVVFAESDVETVQGGERVGGAAHTDDAGGRADVKDADFAALEEEGAAEFLVGG